MLPPTLANHIHLSAFKLAGEKHILDCGRLQASCNSIAKESGYWFASIQFKLLDAMCDNINHDGDIVW